MRTVITGGAGFIGLALSHLLINRAKPSDEIFLVDTLARHGKRAKLDRMLTHPCVHLIQADLTHQASLEQIPSPVDRVYHLAARVGVGPVTVAPADVLSANTMSTLNVFEWFVKNSSSNARLLFTSTSEVYSGTALSDFKLPVPTSENVPVIISDLDNPRFSYALSKMWGEAYAKYLASETGKLLASVRYHNVYGPEMGYDHVIPQIITRVKAREDPFQIIGADQTRSFCWIEDAVEATYRVMEASQLTPGIIVHIGNQHKEIEIRKLYEMVFDLCKWTPSNRVNHPSPTGSVPRRCPDITLLRSLTDYEPSTPFRDGLLITAKWYLEYPKHNLRADTVSNAVRPAYKDE